MTIHIRPIGHISLGVKSLELSKTFYTAIFAPLGLHLVYESSVSSNPRTLGYGPDADHEMINVFEYGDEAHAPGRGSHVAFNAMSREAVREFYKAAVENGGRGDGEPGLREHYGRNYYAAFVVDLDGWRFEAVCKEIP